MVNQDNAGNRVGIGRPDDGDCQAQSGPGLVHHSDRGSQYASKAYQELLEAHQMVCSMSGRGNCYDNAPMESFFGTFKIEVDIERFKQLDNTHARMDIFKYIEVFYNRKRRHSSIGYMSPAQFETLERGEQQ